MIEVGDKVKVIKNFSNYINVNVGCVYEVFTVLSKGVNLFIPDIGYPLYFDNYEVELVESKFTQQDLEVGMYMRRLGRIITLISTIDQVNIYKDEKHVDAIYNPDENGNLIKIWEREEEKLYTLELPNNENRRDRFYIEKNNSIDYYFGNYNQNKATVRKGDKCYFTQREIKNLPNQDFIKQLVKKEKVNDK